MAKLKVVTRQDLREAVDSIESNTNAKKYLSKVIDKIEEDGEAHIEHGDISNGYAFLDYADDDTDEDEPEEEEEQDEDEDEDEDDLEDEEEEEEEEEEDEDE